MSRIRALLAEPDRGATIVEYGLLIAIVTAVVAATVMQVGDQLAMLYAGISAKLK